MTVDYALYAGSYIACVLMVLGTALVVIFNRKNIPEMSNGILLGLVVFLAVLLCLTETMDHTTILRVYGMSGMVGAFVLSSCYPGMARRCLRIVGLSVAGVIVFESVLTWQRPVFLANPNMTAAWLLACWPWMPAPFSAVAIICTQSRAAIAGLVLSLLAMVLERVRASPRARWIILVSIALLTPWAAYLRWATVADRVTTWMQGVQLFAARPLAGWGPGASMLLFGHNFDSAPLTIAVETGMVGLVACGILVSVIAHRAQGSASPARWALLALAIQNIADDTWIWPLTAILIGANLALLGEGNDNLGRNLVTRLAGLFNHGRWQKETSSAPATDS